MAVTIPVVLSDGHNTMLQWAATIRNTTVDLLVTSAVAEFLRPLEALYLAAHKGELDEMFGRLSTEQQAQALTYIRGMLP